MPKVLVIHGPNLNLLGQREKDIYGHASLQDINADLTALAEQLKIDIETYQSNHEGEIVDRIGQAKSANIDAILINPAAYTHTSIAIRDAIAAVSIPTVEVHLSNVYAREEFRHTSLIAPVAHGQISGFGVNSYLLGLKAVAHLLQS